MAHYPEISAVDFSLRITNGRMFQNPVHVPKYAYQHTANFDHYQLSPHDFIPYEGPGPARFVLRRGLAYSLWETVQMKVKYILAAAHNWNGQVDTDPLPSTLPESKITELGMPPPPFPDPMLLSANLFLADEDPEVIRYWVRLWQGISLSLSAWIAKARLNSLNTTNCTWSWPHSPFDVHPAIDHGDSDSDDAGDLSSLFSDSDLDTHFPGTPTHPPATATALSATVESRVPKRARSVSPDLVKEPKPEDMQLVLWQPSPLQILTRETALREGQVRSVADQPVLPPTPVNTPAAQVTAPAPVDPAPTSTSEDSIPILILDNHAPALVPAVHNPVPATDVQAPGPSTVANVSNPDRPVRPLPLRATHISSHQHLVFEYETRSEVQENKGRFGYA